MKEGEQNPNKNKAGYKYKKTKYDQASFPSRVDPAEFEHVRAPFSQRKLGEQ
jgi:hypothetical protein